MRACAFGTFVAIALSLASVTAAAQEPAGYASPFADTLSTRVFPLFAMLRTADGWAQALRDDNVL